jgi:hypothetical protein
MKVSAIEVVVMVVADIMVVLAAGMDVVMEQVIGQHVKYVRRLDIVLGGARNILILSSRWRRSRSTMLQAPMMRPMVWIPIGIPT